MSVVSYLQLDGSLALNPNGADVVPAGKLVGGKAPERTGAIMSGCPPMDQARLVSLDEAFPVASMPRIYSVKVAPLVSPLMVTVCVVPPVLVKVFVMEA